MKKLILTVAAILATSSVFASEPLTINLNNVPSKTQTKKTEGPAFSAQSFAGLPVANNKGQIVGFDLAVLVDKHDQNVAVLRPLGKYKVAGVNLQTVAAASLNPDGNQLYGGFGVMAEVGEIIPGVEASLGAVSPALNTSNLTLSNNIVPALRTKFVVPTLVRHLESTPERAEKTLRRAVVKFVNDLNHVL
jgi:hypothetical protein